MNLFPKALSIAAVVCMSILVASFFLAISSLNETGTIFIFSILTILAHMAGFCYLVVTERKSKREIGDSCCISIGVFLLISCGIPASLSLQRYWKIQTGMHSYNVNPYSDPGGFKSSDFLHFQASTYASYGHGACELVLGNRINSRQVWYCVAPFLDYDFSNEKEISFWAVERRGYEPFGHPVCNGSCVGANEISASHFFYQAIKKAELAHNVKSSKPPIFIQLIPDLDLSAEQYWQESISYYMLPILFYVFSFGLKFLYFRFLEHKKKRNEKLKSQTKWKNILTSMHSPSKQKRASIIFSPPRQKRASRRCSVTFAPDA